MPERKLFTAGNLKFDAELASELTTKTEEIQESFCIWNRRAADSRRQHTRAGRRDHARQHSKTPTKQPVRLMLAPRHPERFNEVAALLQKSGLSWTQENQSA